MFLTVSQSSSRQIGGAVQSPKIGPRTCVFVAEGGWSENIRSSHVVHKDSIRILHVPTSRTQFRKIICLTGASRRSSIFLSWKCHWSVAGSSVKVTNKAWSIVEWYNVFCVFSVSCSAWKSDPVGQGQMKHCKNSRSFYQWKWMVSQAGLPRRFYILLPFSSWIWTRNETYEIWMKLWMGLGWLWSIVKWWRLSVKFEMHMLNRQDGVIEITHRGQAGLQKIAVTSVVWASQQIRHPLIWTKWQKSLN